MEMFEKCALICHSELHITKHGEPHCTLQCNVACEGLVQKIRCTGSIQLGIIYGSNVFEKTDFQTVCLMYAFSSTNGLICRKYKEMSVNMQMKIRTRYFSKSLGYRLSVVCMLIDLLACFVFNSSHILVAMIT